MLSEEQKSLIRAKEALRDAVRAELGRGEGRTFVWHKMVDFLNMPSRWVLGTGACSQVQLPLGPGTNACTSLSASSPSGGERGEGRRAGDAALAIAGDV